MIIKLLKRTTMIMKFLKKKFYTLKLKIQVKSYGRSPYCGGPSSFSSSVILGDNCNFNGMQIIGLGEVIIGNNFHSGTECMIVTSNHDYDNDLAIPYGYNHIKKRL